VSQKGRIGVICKHIVRIRIDQLVIKSFVRILEISDKKLTHKIEGRDRKKIEFNSTFGV
jgi:hypothetical protein